jgi:HSP20 family protein
MRSRIHAIVIPSEAAEFTEELAHLFRELATGTGGGGLTGECAPALDVYETDETVEIAMDLPGIAPEAVRVVAKGAAVLIAGEKSPRRAQGDSSYHLVERGYGRFARIVRTTSACDTSRARAVLTRGELRVSLPKIPDRRNRAISVPIASERPIA